MKTAMMNPWEVLESFQGSQFDRLYESPHSALTIFNKKISETAQSITMTMLDIPRPIAKSDLEMFLGLSCSRAVDQALDVLRRYHMVKQIKLGGVDSYFLAHGFAKSLKQALDGANSKRHCSDAIKLPAIAPTSMADLDEYAATQIGSIINFVINSAAFTKSEQRGHSTLPQTVIELLGSGDLISYSGLGSPSEQVNLLRNGFSFAVEKLDTQLWTLVFLYIRTLSAARRDEVDALSFVCLISSLEPGSAYSTINLRNEQLHMLELLSAIGIVRLNRRPNNNAISNYVPTRLATLLASEIDPDTISKGTLLASLLSSSSTASDGCIAVDNDFHVSAHPLSLMQISLLSLYIDVESRQSNKLSGKITQSSIRRATQQGISAEQIISYLNSHAHPKMRAAARRQQALQGSRVTGIAMPLPSVLADQIRSWELEQDCMTTATELLVKDIQACLDHDTSRKLANETNKLSLADPPMRAPLPMSMGVVESA